MMKKKMIACAVMACALAANMVAPAMAVSCSEPHTATHQVADNEIAPYQALVTRSCTDANGNTSDFDVPTSTRIRFYIENNADFDISVKLQKRTLTGKWEDVDMNGKSSASVKAGGHKEIDTDQSKYKKGTYRFSATGSKGGDYDYKVTMREFEVNA